MIHGSGQDLRSDANICFVSLVTGVSLMQDDPPCRLFVLFSIFLISYTLSLFTTRFFFSTLSLYITVRNPFILYSLVPRPFQERLFPLKLISELSPFPHSTVNRPRSRKIRHPSLSHFKDSNSRVDPSNYLSPFRSNYLSYRPYLTPALAVSSISVTPIFLVIERC